jgi:hypothetical protein
VLDPTNVSQWNSFFDLPNKGGVFTTVAVYGNQVVLNGSSNLSIKTQLFQNNIFLTAVIDSLNYIRVVEASAFSSCSNMTTFVAALTETIATYAFSNCTSLYAGYFTSLTTLGTGAFIGCTSLFTIEFGTGLLTVPSSCFEDCTGLNFVGAYYATAVENGAFAGCNSPNLAAIDIRACDSIGSSVGDNGVFQGITSKTFILRVKANQMTINGGNPDGDITYLNSNNTLTIQTF